MNTTKFDASKLAALLESKEVAMLEASASALGTDAKATIFRKLKEIDYRASYSHLGRFYALVGEDKFDVLGLWSFEDIHFSSYGTLLEVSAALGISPVASRISSVVLASEVAETGPIVTLDEAMKRHIERALEHTGGKIEGKGGVADLLDINPHTLRARMRKLGVAWRGVAWNSFRK